MEGDIMDDMKEAMLNSSSLPNSKEDIIRKYFELFLILPFFAIWIILIVFGKFPMVLLNVSSLTGGFIHYVIPIIFATIIQLFLLTILRYVLRFKGERDYGLTYKETLVSLLYIPFITLVFFLHFNFKAWMPILNSHSFDSFYYEIDSILPIVEWLDSLGKYMNFNGLSSNLYSSIFFAMFMFSFIFHAAFDNFRNFRKVVTGTCAILLIGGLSYSIAPAVGPFIFENSQLDGFYEIQNSMYLAYINFAEYGVIPMGYFGKSPAAMPSLHTANSLFFLLSAKHSLPWLAIIYTPIFIFIIIIAVASKWHYAIDLVFGALLAYFVYWMMNKVFEQ